MSDFIVERCRRILPKGSATTIIFLDMKRSEFLFLRIYIYSRSSVVILLLRFFWNKECRVSPWGGGVSEYTGV